MTDSPNKPLVVAELYKTFGAQKVLDGVSFSVAKGEIVYVLGRSGTCKSVLLRLLVGLASPDAGSIQINGEEITQLGTQRLNELRRTIGFLFQQSALYDSLNLEQNVQFPLRHLGHEKESQRATRATDLLASVGLTSGLTKMPAEISGGMKKRVALARALALNPTIILFDEPTAGLDPITAAEISKLIVDLRDQRGVTSVVVTHEIHCAKYYSDRVLLLSEGKIVVDGAFTDMQASTDAIAQQFLTNSA